MGNKKVFSVGVNDIKNVCDENKKLKPSYRIWYNMLARCYGKSKPNNYEKCYVCEEWLTFSYFQEWFLENYIEGWQLDKDILIKGNKVYSPQTCCFVPKEINMAFTKSDKTRGKNIIGVTYRKGKFEANVSCEGKSQYIGFFDTEIEAFNAYKNAKEQYIKTLGEKYKGFIKNDVYEALLNYKVETTD